MQHIEDLIDSAYDSYEAANDEWKPWEALRHLNLAKSSFIEAQEILEKSVVSGDGPIGIPDEYFVNLVERCLRIVDSNILGLKIASFCGFLFICGLTLVAGLLFCYLFE